MSVLGDQDDKRASCSPVALTPVAASQVEELEHSGLARQVSTLLTHHLARATNAIGNAAGGTCLLYTSPSPRDEESSRMPSSA